jgi:hypothetical protein
MKKLLLVAMVMVLGSGCSSISLPFGATPTPTISNENLSAEIQNYFDNVCRIPYYYTYPEMMGATSFPANLLFQVSDIVIVDKSISGIEATIIAQIKFIMTNEYPLNFDSPVGDALSKYFGNSKFLDGTFIQERKFLFQQYSSGTWRLEKGLNGEVP